MHENITQDAHQETGSGSQQENLQDAEQTVTSNGKFTPEQVRVLACLMEKQLTTPDSYPLTLNSLMLACNQKTNRYPVMNLNQGELGNLTNRLSDDDQVRIKYGSRTNKYSHAMRGNFSLDVKQQAIMCVLMLREPLTLNDINARTARMAEFESIQEIESMLQGFMTRATPLVQCIGASNGRREDRYTHTFCGEVEADEVIISKPGRADVAAVTPQLEKRVAELEAKVEQLESMLDDLTS